MKRLAILASTALAGSMATSMAFAQSTGTAEVEEVIVTAISGPRNIEGVITAEQALKNRSVITQEYIDTQPAGQTIAGSLNLVPGYNFTNADPYGSSGGNIRLHGQSGDRIGLLIDGVPLNDAGNYAIYTNQQLDPELIEQANVNTGSADVDTLTASSTAGVINYTTLRTTKDFGIVLKPSFGTDNFQRYFGLLQTGEVGPFGTMAWVSAMYQKYDKYKGPGDLEKKAVNFRIYQPIRGNGDFLSLTANYNENRNTFYYNPNIHNANYTVPDEVNTLGWDVDYLDTWIVPTVTPGVADAAPAPSTATRGFYGYRINPSNTGTIRGASRFTILDNLHFTFDPSFNYTLANGGGTFTLTETDLRVLSAGGAALDLNGDGDTRDTLAFYGPSNTNTRRYAFNSSLIWDLNENNTIRGAYAYDEGHTRQTGEFSRLTAAGFPVDEFSAKDGYGESAGLMVNGKVGQKRDRNSIAVLQQFSAEYRGKFMDDKLRVSIGVRAPLQKRELQQFCYSASGSTTYTCTDRTPTSLTLLAPDAVAAQAVLTSINPNTGAVTTTRLFAPYRATRKYDAILPSYGASYRLTDNDSLFASYTEQQSSPKVDNLYTLTSTGRLGQVQPEESKGFDFGYRHQSGAIIGVISGWSTDIANRIVSTRDPNDDSFIDRNVGDIKLYGVDAQLGGRIDENFNAYVTATYTHSELQENLFVGGTAVYPGAGLPAGIAPTKGKELVETPKWMFGGRLQYANGPFTAGLQGKWVGKRYITDVNDVSVPRYTVFDLDLRYDLDALGMEKSYVQFNVSNLFDEKYYGNLGGTQTSGLPGAPGAGSPFASRGAPRAAIVTLRTEF